MERVDVQPFSGPTPIGPTFQPLQTPVMYFLTFLLVAIICNIVAWTTTMLTKAGKHATTVQEVKAWFVIRMLMLTVKLSSLKLDDQTDG